MRFVGNILLAIGLLVGVYALLGVVASPAPETLAARVRHYEWLAPGEQLRWRLPAGRQRVELRWRSLAPVTTAVRLSLRPEAREEDGATLIAPLQLELPEASTATLASTGAPLSVGAARFFDVDLEEPTELVAELDGTDALLVRGRAAYRQGAHRFGPWRRLTGGHELGETPEVERVLLLPPVVSTTAAADQADLQRAGRVVQLEAGSVTWAAPVYEPGGVLRLTLRGVQLASTEQTRLAARVWAVHPDGPIELGRIERELEPADLWLEPVPRDTAQLSEAASGLVVYPPGTTEVRLELLEPSAAVLSAATWDGPAAGAGLNRSADQVAAGRWRSMRPVTPTRAVFGKPSPPIVSARVHPSASVSLSPAGQAMELLLLRQGPPRAGELVLLGAQPSRLCPIAAGSLTVDMQALAPAALGQRYTLRRDGAELVHGRLLATSMNLPLGPLPSTCFELAAEGLDGTVLATLRSGAVTSEQRFARRQAWPVSANAPLQLDLEVERAREVRVELFAERQVQGRLRLAVDEGAPRRRAGVWAEHTVPLREVWLAGHSDGEAILLTAGLPRLARLGAWRMRLGEDLQPGVHQLSLGFVGRGRLWVRLSATPEAAP